MAYTDRLTTTFAGLLVAVLSSTAVHADVRNEVAKFLASDGAAGDVFGWSVAISGDLAIVGAKGDDHNGSQSGSAYIFRRSGAEWIEETKLLPSDGGVRAQFGESVALSGDVAIVGAKGDGGFTGAAYIYRRDGTAWNEEAKLLASDGAGADSFGKSVAISGNTVIVGASKDDDNGPESGSAYIYRHSGALWVEEAKLLASDGRTSDLFGASVSISETTAVVGAWRHNDNGSQSGAAYIYQLTGGVWSEEAKLLASDGAAFDSFGWSVSLSGEVAIVGAYKDDDLGDQSGSAYVYRRNGTVWTEEAKLLPSDGVMGDWFGEHVAISGTKAIIGARLDDNNGFNSGSAYIFQHNGSIWVEEAKLLPSDGGVEEFFGWAVAINGDDAVVGTPWNTDFGSAYVFDASTSTGAPATLLSVMRTLGLYISGGVPELLDSDDTYYVLQSGPGFDPSEPHPARANFRFDSLGFPASTLDITLEERANIGGPTAVVLLRNRVNAEWDEIARHSLSPTDQTFEMTGIPAAEYISATNGRITVRVRTFAILVLDPTIRGIFSHDFVGVTMRE